MLFELSDILTMIVTVATGVTVVVRTEMKASQQTEQHRVMKMALDALTREVNEMGRDSSSHEARIDGVEERVDKLEGWRERVAARIA